MVCAASKGFVCSWVYLLDRKEVSQREVSSRSFLMHHTRGWKQNRFYVQHTSLALETSISVNNIRLVVTTIELVVTTIESVRDWKSERTSLLNDTIVRVKLWRLERI